MHTPLGARRCLVPAFVLVVLAIATDAKSFTDSTVVLIEGITITGSRSPEPVLKTPAAVSVVGRQTFESTRQISLANSLQRVPGVFVQSRAGAQDVRVTIRGYGARGNGERSNAGNMRGIRLLTDGVPMSEPDGRTSLEYVDLGGTDRIEVLRSNGSVLYGNASGGVVNLRSGVVGGPTFLDLTQHAGSFGFLKSQAVAGYDIGSADAQTSFYTSKFDGWRNHSANSTTSIQNRISAPLTDKSRLGILLDFVSNFIRFPGALTQQELDTDPSLADSTYVVRDERRFNRVGRAAVTYEHETAETQRLSMAVWAEPKVLQRSERNRFRDFTRYHIGGNAAYQFETPFGSNTKVLWMVGGDEQYQDGAILFYNLVVPGGTRSTTVFQNKREGANSAGAFAQGELRLGAQWAIRVAGRYDNLWYISEDRINPRLNASKHFTQVTPKGSIARYFDRNTLYASIGGGVEAPAFNEIDPPPPYDTTTSLNPFLDPMRSTSYEVGAKGALVEQSRWGHLGYDFALYQIDVENDIVPWNGGAYFFTAGKSRRRGGELGLDWRPVSVVTVDGALTLSENEYVEYVNDLNGGSDFSGNDVAGLPKTILDAGVRWEAMKGLSLSGSVRQVGKYFADDANTAEIEAATVFGAQAEYRIPTTFGLVRAFVAGDNLTDQDYVESAFINGIGNQYFEPGLPANVSFGISISMRPAGP